MTSKDHDRLPSLSVLIPVRNEEKNIGNLLGSLASLPYGKAEIIVCDDGSTDNTADIVQACSKVDPRVRYVQGKELPPGWTGKNHACHILAGEASNDYLLFLDADCDRRRGPAEKSGILRRPAQTGTSVNVSQATDEEPWRKNRCAIHVSNITVTAAPFPYTPLPLELILGRKRSDDAFSRCDLQKIPFS
jgi:glycosyltransferase involved in cell wall biosynthesis